MLTVFYVQFGMCFLAPVLYMLLTKVIQSNPSKSTVSREFWIRSPLDSQVTFERLFDRYVLLKLNFFGYQNTPNANKRIFSSFATALWIATLFYFLFDFTGIGALKVSSVDAVDKTVSPTTLGTAFIGVWLGLFWKEKKDIHSKWEYLANLYNTMIQQAPAFADRSSFSSRESLRAALAHDLLIMQMWGHSSFKEHFEDVLIDAYLHDESGSHGWARDRVKNEIRRAPMKYDDVEELLEKYLRHVIKQDVTGILPEESDAA